VEMCVTAQYGATALIYVRSRSFVTLLRLKNIPGVIGLLTDGDSNRSQEAIQIDNTFVQAEIAKSSVV
jgi:hypothetical protein